MTKFYLTFDYVHVNFTELDEMKYADVIAKHIINTLFFSMKSLSLIISIDDMFVDLDNCAVYLQTNIIDEELQYIIARWNVDDISLQGILDNSLIYMVNNFKINELNSNNN